MSNRMRPVLVPKQIRLSEQHLEALDDLAVTHGVSHTQVIRFGIDLARAWYRKRELAGPMRQSVRALAEV